MTGHFFALGCKDESMGKVLKDLFQASYFRLTVVPDVEVVELCGALKVNKLYTCTM